jgi:acetyltransferase-like isoleucine patch superfamily enzyme
MHLEFRRYLKFIANSFSQPAKKIVNRLSFHYARIFWSMEGIYIHHRANLVSVNNIRIDKNSYIHRDAIVSAKSLGYDDTFLGKTDGKVEIGKNCIIMSGAIIAAYGGFIKIGDSVSINPYSIIYGHGGVSIGEGTRIASHCVIIPANHIFDDPKTFIKNQGLKHQGINIGKDVWLGTGVRILDGVTIGNGAVIGAGGVVTKDISSGSIAVGVPARVIGSRGE